MTDLNDTSKTGADLTVPFLPTDLPFNGEQKQWMGGFLAGLHTKLIMQAESAVVNGATAPAAVAKPLTILFGTQTGNAESVAEDLASQSQSLGFAPTVLDMDDVDFNDLVSVERLLIVTSTYGEGEMPDNAQALWDAASESDAPQLPNTFFSVLALGDTNYDGFCVAGKVWDERLAELGAMRVVDRVDCDVDFEALAESWIADALAQMADKGSDAGAASPASAPAKDKPAKSKFNRNNPLEATLTKKKLLNKEGSSKEILHYEFSLAGSGEIYNAGDALNIIPVNRADLVDDIITCLKSTPETSVQWQNESRVLFELLRDELEIRTPSKEFVAKVAELSEDDKFQNLIAAEDTEGLNDFLWGKDCVDLLNLYSIKISAQEFVDLCKPMAPRAYSISSSINAHPEEVHLTIGSVRYNQHDRHHNGVCSGFLADVANEGDSVKCYFSANKNFAVPEDNNLAMIMVGPGTGIAPFRAFLEERQARNAPGDNWLFFGDRNSETDYIYQDEIEQMQSSGLLTRTDLAFSRDQKEKIYVQDRMIENGTELFAWLERGAYFYICGDAYRMAKDVDAALHQLIEQHGAMDKEAAQAYVADLKKQKRYVRDVY